jgi:flagellar biosynthesis protein
MMTLPFAKGGREGFNAFAFYESMDPRSKKPQTEKAVALKYVSGQDRAPRVTAKGSGKLAHKIIALARENGVPIKEDPALIQILAQLDFYEEIPPSLYVVVAEILAFIYSMNRRWRDGKGEEG